MLGEGRPGPEDFSEMERRVDEELASDEALDGPTREKVVTAFIERTVDVMAHNPRVDVDRIGDAVSQRVSLQGDLDPGLFVDELRGLSRVDVGMNYALSGTPEQTAVRVDVGWAALDGRYSEVALMEGRGPLATTYTLDEDGHRTEERSGDMTREQAFRLMDIVKALESTREEQSSEPRPFKPEARDDGA